jgi:4-alpha-glucanotransferase
MPTVVAGVPPVFSATGQRWGNPLSLGARDRRKTMPGGPSDAPNKAELVDIVRIDHFCGFAGLLNPRRPTPSGDAG